VFNAQRLALGVAALLFLAVAAVYAYSTAFSYFSAYDDEGYAMLTVRGFLEGHHLYSEVFTYYGPFFYLYEWVIHSVLAIPLTHDATTALCVLNWLIASCIFAVAGGLMTRSVLIAFLIFMQATLHLTPLAREPGHPQELVALLLALAMVVCCARLNRKWTLGALASIGAALMLAKVNVGIFYLIALALGMASHVSFFGSRRNLFWIFLVVCAFLPFALMRVNLGEKWALLFASQSCATILAVGSVAFVFCNKSKIGLTPLLTAGAVFAAVSSILVLFVLRTGTPLLVMVETIIGGPSKLGTSFSIPLRVPYSLVSAFAAVFSAGAVVAFRHRLSCHQWVLVALKGLFGVVGIFLMISDYNRELGYLLPWSWLLLIPRGADDLWDPRVNFARIFLCTVAAWESLQAYPVAGTQVVVGTILLTLIYAFCLHDAAIGLAAHPRVARHLAQLNPPTSVLVRTLAFACLFYLFIDQWCMPFSAWGYYRSMIPLGLTGAEYLRLPAAQVEAYRALTQYVQNEVDAFYTVPGFNSLYFWAHKSPPTYLVVPESLLLNSNQQLQVIEALSGARRRRILFNDAGSAVSANTGPLGALIATQSREVARFGTVRVLDFTLPAYMENRNVDRTQQKTFTRTELPGG
jgi:hypothetical protein